MKATEIKRLNGNNPKEKAIIERLTKEIEKTLKEVKNKKLTQRKDLSNDNKLNNGMEFSV